MERAIARILRESGARVSVPLTHMNLAVRTPDARQIEVLAQGLPLYHGAQLAVDTTLVAPLGRTGHVRHNAASTPGDAITRAADRKRRVVYPEFQGNRRCRLIVVGLEVGGRFGVETADFLRSLAQTHARGAPPMLQQAAIGAYLRRWAALLGFAAQRALGATLLELPLGSTLPDGDPPPLHSVLADDQPRERPYPSRTPPQARR